MPGEEIAGHVLITVGIHLMEKLRHVRFLRCRLWKPNEEIRISISAILAISDGGRMVLIRNFRRPEAFGPIGGVCKYYEEARPILEGISFRAEDVASDALMKEDLRGFVPRRNLGKFMSWFERKEDREMPSDCLRRELREELGEVGIPNPGIPAQLSLRKVRVVSEGPEGVPGMPYEQYRFFEVYALSPSSRQMDEFIRRLIVESDRNEDLLRASTSEIIAGRTHDGHMITHHAAYIIGKRRIRPEIPTFSRSR